MPTFPNLFVIGAMKAGTSSLHEYLHQHPEIFMSRFKEPQYFAPHLTRWNQPWGIGNPYPEPGIDWYLRLFEDAGDVKYAGESSVSYTAAPWVEGCAERIHAFNPDARLIYLLRDPIERTLSHYWYFVKDGREDRPMLQAVQQKHEYVARSDYARQLKPYLSVFGRERVHVMTLEELNGDPDAEFEKLFRWLGVDPTVRIDVAQKHNVGEPELRQTRRGLVPLETLSKHWRVKPWIGRSPAAVQKLIRSTIYRRVNRCDIDPAETIEYLRPILQPTVEELSQLLGRTFEDWRTTWPPEQSGNHSPLADATC